MLESYQFKWRFNLLGLILKIWNFWKVLALLIIFLSLHLPQKNAIFRNWTGKIIGQNSKSVSQPTKTFINSFNIFYKGAYLLVVYCHRIEVTFMVSSIFSSTFQLSHFVQSNFQFPSQVVLYLVMRYMKSIEIRREDEDIFTVELLRSLELHQQ